MKTLLTALTVGHVLAGVIALLAGLVPMLARKGGKLHNRTGLLYVWCMVGVAITAMLLCVLKPFLMMRLFLAGIAVLSFYLCLSGWRATKQKQGQIRAFDRGLVFAALACGLAMAGFGLWLMVANGLAFLPVVFTFFGVLMTKNAVNDIQRMCQPATKLHWFYQHFTRMGGSYIATFTAAIVTNVHRFADESTPGWVFMMFWIAPTVVGGALIGRTVAYYKRKFGPKQSQMA